MAFVSGRKKIERKTKKSGGKDWWVRENGLPLTLGTPCEILASGCEKRGDEWGKPHEKEAVRCTWL